MSILQPKAVYEKGDIILNLDGRQIDSIEDVKAVLRTYKNSHKKELTAIIRRDGQNLKTKITPVVTDDGTISLGLYLKDHILGIGTLTFTYKDRFGALGHQIKDNSGLVDERLNDEGVIKRAIVTNIVKGKKGSPGEKKATMFPKEIGIIQENTMTGIFGILKEDISHRHAMPIKAREEVRTGAAQILTVIKGDKVEAFDIEIIEVKNQPTKDIKGLKIRVVDDRLLSETGGIIQGMSGKPNYPRWPDYWSRYTRLIERSNDRLRCLHRVYAGGSWNRNIEITLKFRQIRPVEMELVKILERILSNCENLAVYRR